MADTSDDILRTYIDTVLRLQQEREEHAWSDADLEQAALEAGMTDGDLAYVRQRLNDGMNRGQGFIRYQNWDDAIEELERARALAPNNIDALNALATAHAGRWHRDGRGSDRDQAMKLSERVLQLDSRNDAALRMISALRTNRSELLGDKVRSTPSSGGRKWIIIAPILLLALLAIIIFLLPSSGDPKPAIEVSRPAPPPPPAPPTPPKPETEPESETPADPTSLTPALTFGSEGTGPGLLSDARAIAVDGAGRVYVADYSDGRVQSFDSAGNYLLQWSVGENHYVKGIAADRKGTVYVVHSGHIYRFDGATGKPLGEVKYAGGPGFVDVAVMADGGLAAAWDGLYRGGMFVNPKSEDNLVLFDADMRAVKTIKNPISSVSGNVEFSPQVAVDGLGNLYMMGESGGTVYHFTPQGKYVDKFGDGKGFGMHGMAVDGRGHIFVTGFSGIQEYDGEGSLIRSMTLRGSHDALAFNSKGELYVVGRTKVMKFVMR
jgi:DNA-binding beta-propeller fold protein YncE